MRCSGYDAASVPNVYRFEYLHRQGLRLSAREGEGTTGLRTSRTACPRTPKRHGVTSQTGSESLSQDPILVKRPKVEADWSDDECLRAVGAGSIRRLEAVLTVAWGGCWPAEGLQIDPEHVPFNIHGSYCHQ